MLFWHRWLFSYNRIPRFIPALITDEPEKMNSQYTFKFFLYVQQHDLYNEEVNRAGGIEQAQLAADGSQGLCHMVLNR